MRALFVLCVIALSALRSFAALKSDGKTHFQFLPLQKTAQVTIDKGFHFNLEAPMFLRIGKEKLSPTHSTESKLEFRWQGELSKDAKIQYYVCDDAKTVCEPHTEELSLPRQKAPSPKQPSTITQSTTNTQSISGKAPLKNDVSFILNDLESARKLAAEKKSLILMDFTASWCPACLRLDHETFQSALFKDATKSYILVKLDVDLEKHLPLLEKYSIRAYPSLVVTDATGNELARFLDFLPADQLSKELSKLSTSAPNTQEQIEKKALAGQPEAILRLGQQAFLSQRPKECVDWLGRLAQKPIEYHLCSIDVAEETKNNLALQAKALEDAITAFPDSFYSIEWRHRLAKNFKDQKKDDESKKLLLEAQKLAQMWLKPSDKIEKAHARGELLELKGLVPAELHYALGEIHESLGQAETALKEFENAVKSAKDLKPTTENPTIILYLVKYLKKTQPLSEPLQWLSQLEKAYPQEFTYPHRQAILLFDHKEYSQALPPAQRAYQLSYGTNQLKTGLLLVRIQTELKKTQEAKELLRTLISTKAAQAKTNKHHLEKLQKANEELQRL